MKQDKVKILVETPVCEALVKLTTTKELSKIIHTQPKWTNLVPKA